MNAKEIRKSLEPVDPDKAQVTVSMDVAKDEKSAVITIKSDVKMVGLDAVYALADFTNELAEALYVAARSGKHPLPADDGEH